jgi:protein YIPF6
MSWHRKSCKKFEFQLRDVRAVGSKFKHVLYPKEKNSLLKEWDLWGPLVLCTFMATILQGSSESGNSNDGGPEFAEVFVIVWIGAMVVTLNSKLLGGNM